MKNMENKLSWILIIINSIILSALYPVLVPNYLSEKSYLIGFLIFVGVTGLLIKFLVNYIKGRSKGE